MAEIVNSGGLEIGDRQILDYWRIAGCPFYLSIKWKQLTQMVSTH